MPLLPKSDGCDYAADAGPNNKYSQALCRGIRVHLCFSAHFQIEASSSGGF